MNPYFSMSAIFHLGVRGIRKQLELTIPPITTYKSDPARKMEVDWQLMNDDTALRR